LANQKRVTNGDRLAYTTGLVAHVADGSTKSETTPARRLPTSGDRPLDVVLMDERRDGPRWLCDYDDDVTI